MPRMTLLSANLTAYFPGGIITGFTFVAFDWRAAVTGSYYDSMRILY